MRVLGSNAHDPAAAPVVDGRTVAAAEAHPPAAGPYAVRRGRTLG
ncbi:hypothetical protein AB0D65_19845 [Streptomyces griseoloalbus]|uniref:Uncharacterized protein n=1 Tax=Streptomyces griseoloalbus TaxID=67303 RepID=A0ABV3E9E9_9ACTN